MDVVPSLFWLLCLIRSLSSCSIFLFSWGSKKGFGDVASFWFSPYSVMLSVGDLPSPKFSGVSFVDVSVAIWFLWERVVSPLSNPLLFSSGLGTGNGRVL